MNKENSFSLYFENLLFLIKTWFISNKYPFLAAVSAGLLAHGFAFTNKLLNHDELANLFAKGASTVSGRWGLDLTPLIFPNFSMPWIYGILSVLLLAAAACLIVALFQLRSRALQVLLSGLLVTFPSVTGLFTYMFTSSSYALSIFLAVAAASFLCRDGWKRKTAGVACLVFSLSIYQANVSITASLLLVYLIRQVLTGADTAARIFRRGVMLVVYLGLSAAIYWGALHLAFFLTGSGFGAYASDSLAGERSLWERIPFAYNALLEAFLSDRDGLILTPLNRCLHGLCLLAVAVVLIGWLRKSKEKSRIWLLLLLGALLPLAINSIYLIASFGSIHTLMLYSTASIYVLAAVVIDCCLPGEGRTFPEKIRTALINAVPLCMALIILINTYIANQAYLKLHLRYENTYALCSAINTQVQMQPGFTEQTPVVIVGNPESPSFYENFSSLDELIGTQYLINVPLTYHCFFDYYLGSELKIVYDGEQISQVVATKEYSQMPYYPDYGSIAMIGDTMVVKLSDLQ